jgi:hypothetical protein
MPVPIFVPFVPEIVPFRDVSQTCSVMLRGILPTSNTRFFTKVLSPSTVFK